jgi:hypothetical protein
MKQRVLRLHGKVHLCYERAGFAGPDAPCGVFSAG